MKLFSWMHRKLQKDANGSLQALVAGSSCTGLLQKPSASNQADYITPSNDSNQKWNPTQQCQHHLEEFHGEPTEGFNDNQITEIFPGFLTIGTLSVESMSESPTPTFDLPHQVTNESGIAEMKYDLKHINEELEKFLKHEAEKEANIDSSRKNSQASTINLSDELLDDIKDHTSVNEQIYPLQGYLLGSSAELLETKPKTKNKMTSLCELFKKRTAMEKSYIKEADRTKTQATQKIKSSKHSMNKMLHLTQTSPVDSLPTQRKLNKINHLFHKKVHPEINKAASAANEPRYNSYEKKKKKRKKTLNPRKSYADSILSSEMSKFSCWGTLKKKKYYCSHTDIKITQDAISKKNLEFPVQDTSGGAGREHWINTDEEYFVLELQQNKRVQN